MKRIFIFLLAIISFSCEKPEGPGGSSSIRGKVMINSYDNHFRVLQGIYPAADEDVFIIYGNGNIVSDDVVTAPDGSFEFKFLSKGDYKIFVYSDDTLNNSLSGEISIVKSITLSGNNDDYDAGEISVYKKLDVDDGQAIISGTVYQVNYAKDFLFIKDTTLAQEVWVYLVYEDDLYYSERVRTLHNGTFAIPNLIKGEYKVIVYADDILGGIEKIAKTSIVNIVEIDATADIGNIFIEIED